MLKFRFELEYLRLKLIHSKIKKSNFRTSISRERFDRCKIHSHFRISTSWAFICDQFGAKSKYSRILIGRKNFRFFFFDFFFFKNIEIEITKTWNTLFWAHFGQIIWFWLFYWKCFKIRATQALNRLSSDFYAIFSASRDNPLFFRLTPYSQLSHGTVRVQNNLRIVLLTKWKLNYSTSLTKEALIWLKIPAAGQSLGSKKSYEKKFS